METKRLRLVKSDARTEPPERDLEWVLWNEPWRLSREEFERALDERALDIDDAFFLLGLYVEKHVQDDAEGARLLRAILWNDQAGVAMERRRQVAKRRAAFFAVSR